MPIDYSHSPTNPSSPTKTCWYCDTVCYTFISICKNCRQERRSRSRSKNRK